MASLRVLMIAFVAFCLTGALHAQEDYPTVAALRDEPIPMRDPVALAIALQGLDPDAITTPPTTPPTRTHGEIRTFTAINASDGITFAVDAELLAIGDHIYIYVETSANLDIERIQTLADAFDTRVYPRVRALWGSEATPGIDGDPRIYALFAYNLGASTAAYFSSEHTYPAAVMPTSNEHEMFYFNLDAVNNLSNLDYIESVLAHEFQHMIRHNLQPNSETWINEGASELTQAILYDLPVWEIAMFFAYPDTQLNTWSEDDVQRAHNYGAALVFMLYFYDRYGEDGIRALSDRPEMRGLDALDTVLRELGEPDVNALFADWAIANLVMDSKIEDGRYGYRTLPDGGISALEQDTATAYPYTIKRTLPQYATDYYKLDDLADVQTLAFDFTAPDTVALVPAEIAADDQAWYSNKHDMSSTTLTHAFDLTGVTSATLQYRLWVHTEQYWDYGYLLISTDDGTTWTPLATDHTTAEDPYYRAFGIGYTGNLGWLDESIALDDYAGENVQIRFQLIPDDAVTLPGLLLDSLTIPEIDYHHDFSQDGGAWDAEGWILTDNRLPQNAWVQLVEYQPDDLHITRFQAAGNATWTLDLQPDTTHAYVVISPFAPLTTVPMEYRLHITTE